MSNLETWSEVYKLGVKIITTIDSTEQELNITVHVDFWMVNKIPLSVNFIRCTLK